jgi:hypothetical protein
VASARPFPFQNTTTAPRQSAAAGDSPRRHGLGTSAQASPPVLARIPDVTIGPRRLETAPPGDRPADSAVQYRFDSPHLSTTRDVSARLRKSRRTAKLRPGDSGLQQLSATIRFGGKAWEFVQSYPSALRAVAMFLLTAATGTSMMLMMGHRSGPSDAPTAQQQPPTAATTDPAWTAKPAASATEIEHESSGATTLVPTAIGPTGLISPPPQTAAATAIVGPSPTTDAKPSLSEPLPRFQSDEPLVSRGPTKRHAPAGGYPTTPYPAPSLPGMNAESLPQVQMSEPAPAIARLRGDILDAQPR